MTVPEFSENFLTELRALGVERGDILYVSSDLTRFLANAMRLLKLRGKAQINSFLDSLTDSIQALVGTEGTLLFPIFSWAFCKGETFDPKTTEGDTGAWPNWILHNRTDFLRTQHPMYSFLVWGKDAETLAALENLDAWGTDSPFGYCHKHRAKLLLLDVTAGAGNTFHHYLEEMARVPYRYYKDFASDYLDETGKAERRVYRMYVRDLAIESKELSAEEFYDANKLQKKAEFSGATMRLIDLGRTYRPIVDDFLNHNGEHFYVFSDYTIDWSAGQTHEDDIIK